MTETPKINHNVYILGAGFSRDGGLPLINDFLERMADSRAWLYEHGRNSEAKSVEAVFKFRLHAAGAAYRAQIDVENIEELFSLASATANRERVLTGDVTAAIAATIDFASSNANIITCTAEKKKFIDGQTNSWERHNVVYPVYHLYAGILSGAICALSLDSRNSVITFNYDTLLEDALAQIGVPFSYGLPERDVVYHPSAKCHVGKDETNELKILKLHGSVNWSVKHFDPNSKIKILGDYNDLRKEREELREYEEVLLIPPTWRKHFGGHLTDVWETAVKVLSSATRIIVIGFSMPTTDTHFKYLLAAGLQNNISLRKFLFINPGLRSEREGARLRSNLYSILREELETRGIVQPQSLRTSDFLLNKGEVEAINRAYADDFLSLYPKTY